MINFDKTIQDFLVHPKRIEYENNVNFILQGGKPDLVYYGINFDKEKIVNIKQYFVFFKRLKGDEINLLMPGSDRFLEYYHLYNPDENVHKNNTGSAFAIKMDMNYEMTYYGYYRVFGCVLGKPQYLKLTNEEEAMAHPVSFEYKKEVELEKKYFIVTSEENKAQLSKKFMIDKYLEQINSELNWIEYTETSKWTKILLGFKKNENLLEFIAKLNKNSFQEN